MAARDLRRHSVNCFQLSRLQSPENEALAQFIGRRWAVPIATPNDCGRGSRERQGSDGGFGDVDGVTADGRVGFRTKGPRKFAFTFSI